MKKHTTKKELIEDSDKLDGAKAIGCLFVGIVILAVLLTVGHYVINYFRP